MENLDKEGDGILCPMAMIVKDGKVLLGLRNYTPDKWKEISVWTTPGGRSEKGETIGETLKREVKEEVGITDLKIEKFLGQTLGVRKPDEVLVFKCSTNQEPKLMEPEKFSEWKWFGENEIPDNLINPKAIGWVKEFLNNEK